MFSEVKLTKDLPEYNLHQGMTTIIIDYCLRPEGQEDGYVLEVLDMKGKAFTIIAVEASKIESVVNTNDYEHQVIPIPEILTTQFDCPYALAFSPIRT